MHLIMELTNPSFFFSKCVIGSSTGTMYWLWINSGKPIFVLMSYLFMLLKLAIWMIIFKAYAFNVPKRVISRTQEVNKVGHLSILW